MSCKLYQKTQIKSQPQVQLYPAWVCVLHGLNKSKFAFKVKFVTYKFQEIVLKGSCRYTINMLLSKAFNLQLLQCNQAHSSADVSRINTVWKHLAHCGHNFNCLHHINWKWLNCFASALWQRTTVQYPFSPWPADWLTNAPTSLAGHQSALALSLVNTRVLTHTYTVKTRRTLCHRLELFYLRGNRE